MSIRLDQIPEYTKTSSIRLSDIPDINEPTPENVADSQKRAGEVFDLAIKTRVPIQEAQKSYGQRAIDWAKYYVSDPLLAVQEAGAESWNRGWGHAAISINKVIDYINKIDPYGQIGLPYDTESDSPDSLKSIASQFEHNADYWKAQADKRGRTALTDFIGGFGGVPAGISEFVVMKPLAAGVLGASEAKEKGDSEVMGFLTGAMQRKALGKLFEAIAPYRASIKVPVMAATGAGQSAAEGDTSIKGMATSAGTLAILSLGPNGEIGIRDLVKKPMPVKEAKTAKPEAKTVVSSPDTQITTPVVTETKPVSTEQFIKETSKDVAKGKGTKERKFITSIKAEVPELQIESQYLPESSIEISQKAKNLIKDNLVEAEKIAMKGDSNVSVILAEELVNYYRNEANLTTDIAQQNALYDKASDISLNAARKLTEHGRAVQAASRLGKDTPASQLRFAAREIEKYNEQIAKSKGGIGGLKKPIKQLDSNQTKHILNEMTEIQAMPEGEAKAIRFNNLQNYISELVPSSMYQKIITIWKAGLLTGIKTSGLNTAANITFGATEIVKDIPATVVDKVASIFTGERTTTVNTKGTAKGAVEGAHKALRYLRTGYDVRDIGTKLDFVKTNFGKSPFGHALKVYTESVFKLLGAEDQPFYYAAAARSMYEQAKVVAINEGLKGKAAQARVEQLFNDPMQKMVEIAARDAETAVFQNKTVLSDAGKLIQRIPGGAVVVPFIRTPSAVAMQIVNYSPVGIVKTIVQNIGEGRFDQRTFSKNMGRGITGTATLYIGAKLFEQGLLSLSNPKDERERKLWELEGRTSNSIKINGKWRSVQSLGPVGNVLLIGGHFQNEFSKVGSPSEAMLNALGGSAKSFTEQTFLRGVSQVADSLADPQRSMPSYVSGLLSSTIPTIVGDVARATDSQDRLANGIMDKTYAKIPFVRETLQPKINVLGEVKQPTGNPIELMIDPSRPSADISTPVVKELRRLFDAGYKVSPTLLGNKDGYDVLSAEDNTNLWKRSGTIIKDSLEVLISNEQYNLLPDVNKSEAIEEIVRTAQDVAKMEMVVDKLNGLSGQELVEQLIDFRKSGLATENRFPIDIPIEDN